MKVVLFCGGLGMRMRDYSDTIPKPMVRLRYRPVLWHVMKYYAHFGHKDFILCLGHKGDVIKDYFLNYSELLSNDFVMSDGGRQIDLLHRDAQDWRITFVDTGLTANIGQRLQAVRHLLADEEVFLANYSDGLTDCPLPRIVDCFERTDATATFLSVRPNQSFHVAQSDGDGIVTGIHDAAGADLWINGGYFVLRHDIFDHMQDGEELVLQPFGRLIREGRLSCFRHDGFWRGIDTFKDLQEMERMVEAGVAPWEFWRQVTAKPPQPSISGNVVVQLGNKAGLAGR